MLIVVKNDTIMAFVLQRYVHYNLNDNFYTHYLAFRKYFSSFN